MKTGIYWQDPKYALKPGRDFIFDPSLVLYLPLYQLDGASFMSRDGYGHLCTVTGALWTPHGRSFDGDDYINCGNNAIMNFTSGAFSIEEWIKTSDYTHRGRLFNRGTYNADGYDFWLDNKILQFRTNQTPPASQISQAADAIVANNTWYHCVVTRDGAVVKIYVDTTDLTSTPGTHVDPTSTSANIYIGVYQNLTESYWVGTIGEVRVYNRALTPLEIQRNYLATKWRYQ